jgi:beta-lactamase regulating signal transducer with metallopeptidase domain
MSLSGDNAAVIAFALEWIGKVTLLLALAWAATAILRQSSAALRHRIWAIVIATALLLPIVSVAIPAWHLIPTAAKTPNAQVTVIIKTDLPASALAPAAAGSDWDIGALWRALLIVWIVGAAFFFLRLTIGLLRLTRMAAYSRRAPSWPSAQIVADLRQQFALRRKVRVLESPDAATMPMTWGLVRPRIILPASASEWDSDRQRIVLSHEFAHIARCDWPFQICGEALRACFWFHPLAWTAAGQLRQESERASDDAVLNSGIEAREYAGELLALAKTLKTPAARFSLALALSLARSSSLERRFASMLNTAVGRKPLSKKTSFALAAIAICLLLPLAALTLSAQAPATLRHASGLTAQTLATQTPAAVGASEPAAAAVPGISRDNETSKQLALAASAADALPRPASTASPANHAAAQPQSAGSIAGIVVDPSGAVIQGALVSITYESTPAVPSGQVITGQDGEFQFPSLLPGNYTMMITQHGFKAYTSQHIQLSAGEHLNLHAIWLNVGAVTQEVTVTSNRTATPAANTSIVGCPANDTPATSASDQSANGNTGNSNANRGSESAAANVEKAENVVNGVNPRPVRVKVGGVVEQASIICTQPPVYPEPAKIAGIQGTVSLKAIIGKNGAVQSLEFVSGPPLLLKPSMDAVRNWRYKPLLLNGEPVEVETSIDVVYSLSN